MAYVERYIRSGEELLPHLAQASPYDRWAAASVLSKVESNIKPHQWGHQWRANDVRSVLGLDRRKFPHG
jgi:hypothetical protein